VRRLVVLVLVLAPAPAAAQGQDPVAGYVVDLRGATSGLPAETVFFPGIPLETVVPARGFGFDVAGHVYLFRLGPSRVGIGANYIHVRGTAPGVVASARALAPQVSFNFGTANGWSYLSAGVGRASVTTRFDDEESEPVTAESGGLNATNYGGGARWFLARRLAVGFDARFHRISGPPKTSLFTVSVGFSVR
jgi:hypothetical protein